MENLWWQLPGPSSFLDLVEQDLREGKSVLLALPEHPPEGLREALAGRVRPSELWGWRVLDLTEEAKPGEQPVAVLHRRFPPLEEAPAPCTVRSLVGSACLRGLVIWVAGMDAASWSRWRPFLEQYEHACRAVAEMDRALFCIPVVGALVQTLPTEGVALTTRRWEGVIERLDMALFVTHLTKGRYCHPLHRRVAVSVTVEVALTDPLLARELANADLPSVLDPLPVLTELAGRRGWTAEQVRRPQWHVGMVDQFEGSRVVHSAAVALQGQRDEIDRRIWRGQIGVLFPFIEEQRLRLLNELRRYLSVPLETPLGRITDLRDLELGHLISQLQGARVPGESWRLLRCLKGMRDSLAHLEPVRSGVLLSAEVLRCRPG
jgi:hypothetical protein